MFCSDESVRYSLNTLSCQRAGHRLVKQQGYLIAQRSKRLLIEAGKKEFPNKGDHKPSRS